MRVNVSKASFSKTFMYGLKVSHQRQLTKSNNKSLEFYLNLIKIINKNKPTAAVKQFVALTILVEFVTFVIFAKFATFANLLPTLQLNIFISFNVFNRLTVLMNDFRLKTFYNKASKSSKFNKTIKISATSSSKSKTKKFTSTLTSASTINLKLSATSITLSSSAAAAATAFATSATLFKQTSSKNNHHRTYNNSSKSNKVFLYYTPRDPRLRIFLKTKHFSNRPQQQQQQQQQHYQLSNSKSKQYNNCCSLDKSLFQFLYDLCSNGELIGGDYKISGEYNSGDNQTIVKQLNSVNTTSYNLNKTQTICDNTIKASDNLIVATAGAAIKTINSANILIANIIIVAVINQYSRELLKSIEILLSFHQTHQELKIFNVKSSFNLYESIL